MSTRSQREQLSQTLYYDIMNKNTMDLLRADWLYAVQLGNWVTWVELSCVARHPSIATQLDVELSWVASAKCL